MIKLFSWPTPNGYKIKMMLEECFYSYEEIRVDIGKGQQYLPEFLKISPNNRIPAIIDEYPLDGGPSISVFESGAILLYLAEKKSAFLPVELRKRLRVIEWLIWQVAGLGPMAGQNHHFNHFCKFEVPYAQTRYTKETERLYKVLDQKLLESEYIAGEFSIADIACFPWIRSHKRQKQKLSEYPNIERWFDLISVRPATRKAYNKKSVL